MESFYGGRQGNSCVIKKSYESINAMNNEIGIPGKNLQIVSYGEYVIIDRPLKNEPENDKQNGNLYRRGFDGMEYIGCIVGPAGVLKEAKVKPISEIDSLKTSVPEGDYESNDSTISVVDGKTHNKIKYSWVAIRDTIGNYIGCWVGFEVPCFVLDMTAKVVSPYTTTNLVTEVEKRNFYKNVELSIPKGVHGTDVKDVSATVNGTKTTIKYKEYDYTTTGTPAGVTKDIVAYDIGIDTGSVEGEGSQKLTVSIQNSGAAEPVKTKIGNPINYIIETVMTSQDVISSHSELAGVDPYHLYVLYSDKEKRGTSTYYSVKYGRIRNDYVDLGYVKGETGGLKLIGEVNSVSDFKTTDGSRDKTPKELVLSKGLTWNDEYAGWAWLCEEGNRKNFYSYDYVTKTWINIGSIEKDSPEEVVVISENEPNTLVANGVWLVTDSGVIKNAKVKKIDGSYNNAIPFCYKPSYIDATNNSGNNNLEHELILGGNCITSTKYNSSISSVVTTREFRTESQTSNYYILETTEKCIDGITTNTSGDSTLHIDYLSYADESLTENYQVMKTEKLMYRESSVTPILLKTKTTSVKITSDGTVYTKEEVV